MEDIPDFEEYPSPFAHPLTKRNEARSRRAWQVMATTTGLCLAVGIVAVLIAAWANRRPTSNALALPALSAVSVAPMKTAPAASAGNALGQNTQETRPSLAYYTQDINGGMFHAPQPAAKSHRVTIYHHKHPVETSHATEPSLLPAPPVEPFIDWSYDGTVKMGDKVMALLENTKTKEGQYVRTGDTFLDARVGRITERSLTLHSDGKTYTLPKSQQITVVPLDKSAPYLTASATQPSNVTEAMPGQTAAFGLAGYTPEQRAMMRQYWRQYRQMYRNMGMGGGAYGSGANPQMTYPQTSNPQTTYPPMPNQQYPPEGQ